MATKMEQLRRSEPVYAHLLGGRRDDNDRQLPAPEHGLIHLKKAIQKRGDALERAASAHANDLRRLGREAHEALLDLAGYSLDRDNLLDMSGRLVTSVDTITKVEA